MTTEEKLTEFVAVLEAMKKYDRYSDLPDTAPVLALKGAKRRDLCAALDLAKKSVDGLTNNDVSRLVDYLDALPADWPANLGSFIYHFAAIARGGVPHTTTMDTSNGEVTVAPLETPTLH